MREILFRGFHPDENGSKTITLNGKKIKGKWVFGAYDFNKEHKQGFIICVGIDNVGPIAYIQEVIPETVGQFTGLTDKNGNKIFEGDIVQSEEYQQGDEVGEVVYDSKDCTYWVHSEKYGWWQTMNEIEMEVIGNKWEVEQ